MTDGKQRQLRSLAFGSEPEKPDVPLLAAWVAERRGTQGDLTSFLLAQALLPELEAGVTLPSAGGKFYRDRLTGCFLGLDQQTAVSEIGITADPVIADAIELSAISRGVIIAMPAPHLLGFTDNYYHDKDEWAGALTGAYRSLMRSMRDAGCGGHVLVCDRILEDETAALAKKKVFFFHPAPEKEDLEVLLERQSTVAVQKQDIGMALDLADEYNLLGIAIIDPDEASIRAALARLDPENVSAGGYCSGECPSYWKSLVASAVYRP